MDMKNGRSMLRSVLKCGWETGKAQAAALVSRSAPGTNHILLSIGLLGGR